MSIEWPFISSLITLIVAVAAFYFARKKDASDSSAQLTEMIVEMRTMRRDLSEMKEDVKGMRQDQERDRTEIIKMHSQIEKIWFYIDQFKDKIQVEESVKK